MNIGKLCLVEHHSKHVGEIVFTIHSLGRRGTVQWLGFSDGFCTGFRGFSHNNAQFLWPDVATITRWESPI